ncbi:MAG: universal stress protein [Gammaproteobacteria bacterium]|nr:universal stress protein [Gammaproteobacteria bacterium]
MSYKDILVHVDETKACDARLDVAVGLAERFEAHLTGIYVDPGLAIPTVADVQISPVLLEGLEEDQQRRRAEATKRFESRLERSGVAREWRIAEGELVGTLTRHARYADLIVMGQDSPEEGTIVVGGLPDAVALACGRPILVVPYIGVTRAPGGRVIVAWNATREAARAVNDALPLLRGADVVEVLSINAAKGEEFDADLPGADISLHLARHGVTAEARQIVADDIDVGEMLLSHAADNGADLIVMGAYGHARFREVVLGGATRQLLRHMTVPVLMSH